MGAAAKGADVEHAAGRQVATFFIKIVAQHFVSNKNEWAATPVPGFGGGGENCIGGGDAEKGRNGGAWLAWSRRTGVGCSECAEGGGMGWAVAQAASCGCLARENAAVKL